MNISEYINYPEEKNTDELFTDQEIVNLITEKNNGEEEDDDDSIECQKITHKEAQNALKLITQYLVQQDLDNAIKLKYNETLSNLHKEIKRLQNGSISCVAI